MKRLLFTLTLFIISLTAFTENALMEGKDYWLAMSDREKITYVAGFLNGSYSEWFWVANNLKVYNPETAKGILTNITVNEIIDKVDSDYQDPKYALAPIWFIIVKERWELEIRAINKGDRNG